MPELLIRGKPYWYTYLTLSLDRSSPIWTTRRPRQHPRTPLLPAHAVRCLKDQANNCLHIPSPRLEGLSCPPLLELISPANACGSGSASADHICQHRSLSLSHIRSPLPLLIFSNVSRRSFQHRPSCPAHPIKVKSEILASQQTRVRQRGFRRCFDLLRMEDVIAEQATCYGHRQEIS